MSGRKTRQDQAPPRLGQLMGSTREPINLVTSYYTSTPNKYRYKATATGEGEALSDLYLAIDAIGDEPPRAIEVTVRFV
jgi:hypothetical protein